MNTQQLQNLLCESLCAQANVSETRQGLWRVDTPFTFPDGDAYSLYVQQLPSGGVRISDMGSTLMHLSYENDIDKFREGSRGRLFHQILAESAIDESDGEFYVEAPISELGHGVFRFGQTLTRIHDLTFLNRLRVESTFYEDLRETLKTIVDVERLHEGHVVEGVPNAADYPVDYYIEGGAQPLYLFGVPSGDKARLATIVLQHLTAANFDFNSMVIFQNSSDIPGRDLSRLMNAANDMVASLDAVDVLERKVLQRIK